MKSITIICLLSTCLSYCGNAIADARNITNLNSGWRFSRQDYSDGQKIELDDSGWQSIDLPHSWNNLDGQDGGNNYYRGPAWYRRHLPSLPAWSGKSLILKFDGSSISTSVYVNGKLAGDHAGSFGAFCFDITSLANTTGDNVIAVRVSNARDRNIPPLAGDFTVFGGIYRSVTLFVLDPLHFSTQDNAAPGISVKQDNVTTEKAELTCSAIVHDNAKPFSVRFELLDTTGVVVATAITPTTHGDGTSGVPVTALMSLSQPHLWNGRVDPYLYHVRASLLSGDAVTDQLEQPVGLRFFNVDPDKGFYLNGKPYRLYGVSRHQDRLDKGWALNAADHQSDFDNLYEMGCTAVRLAHYQQAQEFYDLCDQHGIIVWAELPLVNLITKSKEFDDNCTQQLNELIKQNINHPSICFWSLSNELQQGKAKVGADYEQDILDQALITKLNLQSKQLDSTRLTVMASDRQPGAKKDLITDLIAFNRYYGWYTGNADDWASQLDKIHAAYPARAVGISEYGAGASIDQHDPSAKKTVTRSRLHPEEYQALVHERAWDAMRTRPWMWCAFIWNLHDFAVDFRDEGEQPGRNDKGLITFDGKTKKDAFYFYKANWSAESMVYITDRRFTPRNVADAPIKIYSNCDAVDLQLNGTSLGVVKPNEIHIAIWPDVHLKPGENVLSATGSRPNQPSCTDTCTIKFESINR